MGEGDNCFGGEDVIGRRDGFIVGGEIMKRFG